MHGPTCVPWALHYNFIEYTQFHTTSSLRSTLANGRDGQFKTSSPFEAYVDFYVHDYNDYIRAFHDEYYLEVIAKDEDNFVDKGHMGDRQGGYDIGQVRAISTMGICRSIIKDGKVVVDVPDKVWKKWDEYQKRKSVGRVEGHNGDSHGK